MGDSLSHLDDLLISTKCQGECICGSRFAEKQVCFALVN